MEGMKRERGRMGIESGQNASSRSQGKRLLGIGKRVGGGGKEETDSALQSYF